MQNAIERANKASVEVIASFSEAIASEIGREESGRSVLTKKRARDDGDGSTDLFEVNKLLRSDVV